MIVMQKPSQAIRVFESIWVSPDSTLDGFSRGLSDEIPDVSPSNYSKPSQNIQVEEPKA